MGGSITKEGDVFIDAVPFAIVDLLISRVGNVQVVSVILLCLPQNEAFSQHYLIYRWIWWISSTPRFVFSLRVGCANPILRLHFLSVYLFAYETHAFTKMHVLMSKSIHASTTCNCEIVPFASPVTSSTQM
jgi:hypothetical protein